MAVQLEMLKNHAKWLERMESDRPSLYGLIPQHMNMESKEKVEQVEGYQDWSQRTGPEKLWQAIIRTHKVDCVSNAT
jgi:hypothetical protein